MTNHNLENKHILIVEDDPNTRITMSTMLRELGFRNTRDVSDGQAALKIFDDGMYHIDLIISDWNMPNKTGFEILREIRTTHPDLPFIMVTARIDANSVVNAKNMGVTAYLRKPFTLDELKRKVYSVLK